MSRTIAYRDKGMKHAAIKLLQVSAAYFALSSTPVPSLGLHYGLGSHYLLTANRLAAGAWPMIVIPVPAPPPRKPGEHADKRAHWLALVAPDENA